jgi:hypothetical protein
MAILTVHHWSDPAAGLREMARVAMRQAVFYFEPLRTHTFWALEDFPTATLPTELHPPDAKLVSQHPATVRHVAGLANPRKDGLVVLLLD